MRPGYLKTFLVVANRQSFTRAASQLHLAQSSVSDQIQVLETTLGTSLFVRSRAGLELTPSGKALKPYAEEILALIDEARTAVGSADADTTATIAIGALETIASARVPGWLTAFRNIHPDLPVQVRIAGSAGLFQMLENGDAGIVFCFDRGQHDDRFFKRRISAEPLALVTSPRQRQLPAGYSLSELADGSFVTTGPGCIYRHLFDRAFAEAGATAPRPVTEVDSIRTIVSLAAAGAGLALVPRLAVIDMLERGDLVDVPWPGPTPAASLVAIWRRRRVQPVRLLEFLGAAGLTAAPVRPADAPLRHAGPSRS